MPEEIVNIEDLLLEEEETETSKDEIVSVDDLDFEPGKTTDPASNDTDSGSGSGSSVLLDRIEAGDFGEEPKDEAGQLKQIPGYYDQEKITPDLNVGYFPGPMRSDLITEKGVPQRIREGDLMQPTDQITNQVAEFYTCLLYTSPSPRD